MKKLFVVLVMLFAMNVNAQWVNVPNGLVGTNQAAYSLASKGNYVFAGYGGNIYVSTNDGTNWSVTFPNIAGRTILIDSNNVYLGTTHGIYLTTNNGTNWSVLGDITQDIYALAKYGDTIFAGNPNGVYRSTNNGVNWAVTSLYSLKWIQSMAIKGNNIFAGSMESPTVWRSTDNGNNWDSISLGTRRSVVVFSLVAKGNNIFAGTDNGGVFVSSNNGLNWLQTSLSEPTVLCISISGNYIFAGSQLYIPGGVYLSTNDGVNWINKNQGMGDRYIWSLTTNSQYIFAGTETSIWRRSLTEIVSVKNISSETPSSYSLSQNYPNPFNPTTKINFDVVRSGDVKIVVYDIMGREVQTLVNESLKSGTYETTFDGSMLNSGVYFYKLITDGFSESRRMVLLK
jgi:photosystem II stability/assembly factor-like uncharacterized protein